MAVDLSVRSNGVEIMDDLNCAGEVVEQTLTELDIINRWLGGNTITIKGLGKVLKGQDPHRMITIADLGCGSGEMLRLIAKWGSRKKRKFQLIGIDANPNIVRFAKAHSTDFPEIQFESRNVFSEEFQRQKFDIVLATLFLHHFTDDQLTQLFRQLKEQARIGVIINDIHRHPLAYNSIRLLTKFFSKSAMVQFDAPLSVLRAFKRNDLERFMEEAGITNYRLDWKWAFRWRLIIKTGVFDAPKA